MPRGGIREGAGRPSKGKVTTTFRIKPETKEKIDRESEKRGISQGDVIDEWAESSS